MNYHGYAIVRGIGSDNAALIRVLPGSQNASVERITASASANTVFYLVDFRDAVNPVPGRANPGTIEINTGIAIVNNGNATANVSYTLNNSFLDCYSMNSLKLSRQVLSPYVPAQQRFMAGMSIYSCQHIPVMPPFSSGLLIGQRHAEL
jgi:hypothetical protein